MLVGIFLNNYKTYKNLHFIPLIKDGKQSISIFIGDNGSGKSSILEALDTFFNDMKWVKHIDAETKYSSICVMFMIEKATINQQYKKIFQAISDYLWKKHIDDSKAKNEVKNKFKEFVRKEIKNNFDPNNYYLIITGLNSDTRPNEKIAYLDSTMTSKIKYSLRVKTVNYEEHIGMLNVVKNKYYYIYLPLHNSPTKFLDIQRRELQGLMDQNVFSNLCSLLNENFITNTNLVLSNFISSLNRAFQVNDTSYKLLSNNPDDDISPEIIVDHIISIFLSQYSLTKSSKKIDSLSSGEQRIAAIDVVNSLLSSSSTTFSKELILAIDEPEASLSAINCLIQFQKLFAIGEKTQVMIATHWYGLLINTAKVSLIHLIKRDGVVEITYYDLSKIHDERRHFPDNFQMKSYFDLASSILSIIRSEDRKWIICEGTDDKNYLSKILGISNSTINILPVGGCDNVIKLFKYFVLALDDNVEKKEIKGKVLFLIDTDDGVKDIKIHNYNNRDKIQLYRFQILNDGQVDLVKISRNQNIHKLTELEDCLCPKDFYDAVSVVVREKGDSNIRAIFSHFKCNEQALFSGVNYDLKFIFPTDNLKASDVDIYRDELKKYLANPKIKSELSNQFTRTSNYHYKWIKPICEFLEIECQEEQ